MKKMHAPARPKKKASLLDPSSIPVRDVMRTDVLRLQADDTVEAAVELFEEYKVSGAPVVDEAGHAVGVLSISDIAHKDHMGDGKVMVERPRQDRLDEFADEDFQDEVSSREDYSPEVLGRVRVKEWMTVGVVHVGPEASVAEVSRIMINESIHRVFVVEGAEIRGVVSTYDLVRLLAAD